MRRSDFVVFGLLLICSGVSEAFATTPPPTNALIDLTIPASQEPQTDVAVFDESFVFAPNFAINQNDPALSDIFSSAGKSELCFPTSLAEALVDLFAYHAPRFDALQLSGLSANRSSIDPNALVHQLTTLCKTDLNKGTQELDGLQCVASLISQAGYGLGDTKLISPFDHSANLPVVQRQVTIQDLRSALKSGFPVILETAWFSFDPATKQWIRRNGHYVSVYGYDYDLSWGENQIQLKVINPETNYGSGRMAALWDTVTVEKFSPQPGVVYPPNRSFILSGAGFGGATKRGFLGLVLVLAPSMI
jgi:hypothetical protein